MTTVLLTGLPRSGTTLACNLLNRLPNTIALTAPMSHGNGMSATAVLEDLHALIARVRKAALERGVLPAQATSGLIIGNATRTAATTSGSCNTVSQVHEIPVGKPLTDDFHLYVRQSALFTALGAQLPSSMCLYALVRSPLDVLVSWQASDLPMTECLDHDLRARLATMPDQLDRQIAVMGWYLRHLVQLPPGQVIRYEDLIANPAATLSAMQPFTGRIDPRAYLRASRDQHARVNMAELAGRLETIAPLAERFYPRFRHTLREVRGGAPIVLRNPGLDGKGQKKRIDFLIAGVQKGGTTALAALLAQHPSVRLANRKEAHFFDDDSQDWTQPDYQSFHCWFRPVIPGTAVWGEATPIYLFLPEALRRIRRYNPAIRFVIGLRHPTFRAHSQWRMQTARGLETLGFAEAISAAGRARRQLGPWEARTFSYIERGLYARQLHRLFRLFPRENVHILRTDRLWRDGPACLAEICGFLGIEPMAQDGPSRYLVPIDTRHIGHIGVRERRYLDRVFRSTIEQTQALTGLDLSDWLDPAYEEPMPARERNAS